MEISRCNRRQFERQASKAIQISHQTKWPSMPMSTLTGCVLQLAFLEVHDKSCSLFSSFLRVRTERKDDQDDKDETFRLFQPATVDVESKDRIGITDTGKIPVFLGCCSIMFDEIEMMLSKRY